MAVLYVAEQGAVLRRVSQRLLVAKGGTVLEERTAFSLERVLLFGNVQATTQTLALLLENGTEVGFFSLSGRLRGTLTSPKARNVILRLAQFDAWRDPVRRLALARSFVAGKVRNLRTIIQRYQRSRGLDFTEQVESLGGSLDQVVGAADLDRLRGVEGMASRIYFQALRRAMPEGLGFSGRERRPPPDPVNALLSLGYSLLSAELGSLLEGLAFDPHVGYLHGIRYGRLSLALDLVEEFRAPLVDTFVGELLNKDMVGPDDFTTTEGRGCRLTPDAFRLFFRQYEERMRGGGDRWRNALRRQAEELRAALLEGEEYRPYAVR